MIRDEPESIGQVSLRTGCNIETIRYYERIGLLPEPPRSYGGHRLYSGSLVKRLNFIRRARQLGFHLDEVRELLSLVDSKSDSCADVKEMTLSHLREVDQKLADLRKLKRVLGEMASQCDRGQVPECPVIEALMK
ncbi:helix-turn-helix domain-containing protein [Candidatus Acetothermia bacterium]|nr:helix-turn-helix domain-containing protein [Candidatus Acetothermia bacterium]